MDKIIKNQNSNNVFNLINQNESGNLDSSSFFQNSHSMLQQNPEDSNFIARSVIDEYVDDDDPGFDLYECEYEFFKDTCKKLSEQYDFPRRAFYKSKYKNNEGALKELERNRNEEQIEKEKEKGNVNGNGENGIRSIKNKPNDSKEKIPKGESAFEFENEGNKVSKKGLLPSTFKFLEGGDKYYPVQFNNVILDCFNLKVIVDRERTGFEESREFKVIANTLVAGRYQVIEYLGEAAFSTAIKVNRKIKIFFT